MILNSKENGAKLSVRATGRGGATTERRGAILVLAVWGGNMGLRRGWVCLSGLGFLWCIPFTVFWVFSFVVF